MTMEPSRESVARQLQLSDEALGDARYLFDDNRLLAAVNRTYYAMFYAASAALASASVKPPKSHRGIVSLFYRHFVEPGRMARQFHHDFAKTFELRQRTDYEIHAHIGKQQVEEALRKAEAFVAEVKKVCS